MVDRIFTPQLSDQREVKRACVKVMHRSDPDVPAGGHIRNGSWQLIEAIAISLFLTDRSNLTLAGIHELLESGTYNLCQWFEADARRRKISAKFVELARSGSHKADSYLDDAERRITICSLESNILAH